MSLRRTTIALLTTTLALATSPAQACWLTDWLYGRNTSPYTVGYAPYVAGYAPVTTVQPTGLLSATPTSSYRLPIVNPRGAYSLQRPAYLDNPSVYTGRPVVSSAVAPTLLPLRGANTTSNPFYGTGNQYPTNFLAPTTVSSTTVLPPVTSPSAVTSYQPAVVTDPVNSGAAGFIPTPPSALPAANVAPAFVTPAYPAPQRTGGLARFFGSLFGTNYRSSYYTAPVTYYRPATTLDPITGTTVTVQRPCDSYSQLLQRTPYAGFQVAPSTVAPTNTCDTPYQPQPVYGSSVGQVSGIDSALGSSPRVVPIPSSTNALPLTGPRADAQDLDPVDQPSLVPQQESRRPSATADVQSSLYNDGGSDIPADGQWRIQSSSDPEASYRLDSGDPYLPRSSSNRQEASETGSASSELGAFRSNRYDTVRTIPAPSNYRSPYEAKTLHDDDRYVKPSTEPRRIAPLSRESDFGNTFTSKPTRGETSRETRRLSVPVREASMETTYRRDLGRSRMPANVSRSDDLRNARPAPTRKSKSKWYAVD